MDGLTRTVSNNISFHFLFFHYQNLKQELVSTKNSGRLKKFLCIGLTMLVIVVLIGTAYYFYGMVAPHPGPSKLIAKPSVTLNDYLDNKLYAKRNNATWISDTELMYRDSAVSGSDFRFRMSMGSIILLLGLFRALR